MRVVEVEPVAEHRVRERRVRGRQPRVVADHGRLRLAAELGHRLPALAGDAGRVRREAAAERVEEVELGVAGDVLRHVVERQRRRELGAALSAAVMPRHTVHSSSVPGNVSCTSGASRL